MTTPTITKLSNGLRIVTHAMPHLETVSLGLWVGAGARHETERQHLHRLINRLSRYGDRIYIAVHEKLRDKVHIDSSVFNLVLES